MLYGLNALSPIKTLTLISLSAWTGVAMGAAKPDFNHEIRPILASKCYACHGPDEDKREAGLRLDVREEAVKEAIVPGFPEKSEFWHRLVTTDKDDIMPPPSSPKQLTEKERDLLNRWIKAGAEYQQHWSFLPVKNHPLPKVGNAVGVRNGIDLFIRQKLEKNGFPPSAEADPITLIRRVSLDITGLPPTPEEVAAFTREFESSPRAYDQLVDRLLASPHYGERWGRHWLDLARYADSEGFLGDKVRPNAYHFRDWVIESINHDLPFDQFTIEQIAGDLLPEAQVPQLQAVGFHRNAALNTEAGVDKEEARFQNLADRVNTTSRVWMGLTLGCAQCHTHKYDPITIRDYYSFYAYFNNTQDLAEPKTKAQTLAEVTENRRQAYVHLAGDYARRGPDVIPATLSALPKLKTTSDAEQTRLDLAKWLVSPQHPLTSRVAVNQVWSKLFGTGIVSTPDDFGTSGESPSHPELLDWLAIHFMKNGWSRKELIRLIVTSATYRQSSLHRDDILETDPLNRLLSRQNRLRLEAEVLRDSFLTASGLLSRNIGGPSIKPPLPGDVFDVGRSVKWELSEGNDRYRRGLYILTMRSILYPMLTTFDAPDASEACVKRDRSNTPLQALTLMNDPVFVEAAQALALRVIQESPRNTAARLNTLFHRCLSRHPRPEETQRLLAFHAEQKARVKKGGADSLQVLSFFKDQVPQKDAQETAVLVALARVLLNLDEFINRE
ncbi:cytochrome c [Prosthecobacter fusiformis]|uniref:Cytochrome c n=1 Tax=Prosthecobacter fusiformis TaxID=48464 RepID=A0A4R7RSL7_9BACT|nr:PSD1 and planctomycete cytochrome C domain-containing protein [Prosthecobacter fusiformis]TDU68129.1 cytochrome c [Prosthecobacter fusiformis]